jgi:hypothetical protein
MKYIILSMGLLLCLCANSQQRDIYENHYHDMFEKEGYMKFMADTTIVKRHVGDLYGGGVIIYVNLKEDVSPPNYTFSVFGYIMALNDLPDSTAWDTSYAKTYSAGGFHDWYMPTEGEIFKFTAQGFNYLYTIKPILAKQGTPISDSYKYWCTGRYLDDKPAPAWFNGATNVSRQITYIDAKSKLRTRPIRQF